MIPEDEGPTDAGPRRNKLLSHAAVRERVVDDHMFTIEGFEFHRPPTFRLQLFTAPGVRPVAVATQTLYEGLSLLGEQARCVAAVWQQHFPDLDEPPIWVQHMILDEGLSERIEWVPVTVTGRYTVTSPSWHPLSSTELQELVGQPVDVSRGDGYVPREPEPAEEPHYRATWVVGLPRPHPCRADECMAVGTPWWRRLGRQLVPRRTGQDCCWYHTGDWHKVNEVAIRLVRQAQCEGVAGREIPTYVSDVAAIEDMTDWERRALWTLLFDHIAVGRRSGRRWRRGYVNGNHRAQAMLDAGVRRTITVSWRVPDAVSA